MSQYFSQIKLLILLFMIVLPTVLSQVTTSSPKPPLSCYVCGGSDNACNTKEDLGRETVCPGVAEVCSVATESDKVYRKCGREGEVIAECVNQGTFCTCKGSLCNTGHTIKGPIALALITFVYFINL
eukprot:TRINITY_DN48013_c0_g1_i1.p1 TRINITY_DN48013_c0_g1~~TRINITY_DN48013_c0_g1_i1.p1  ORF type:complete len:141 (+),score=29.35 TRINITY_DN48013_c0_g1_i1:43-423(+)